MVDCGPEWWLSLPQQAILPRMESLGALVNEITPALEGRIDPIFTSVKTAAQALGISTWSMYQLLDDEARPVESRYKGSRRLVVVESLRKYAADLPTERPEKDAS